MPATTAANTSPVIRSLTTRTVVVTSPSTTEDCELGGKVDWSICRILA